MLSRHQQIAVCLLAALSVVTLMHAHAAFETASSHCSVCIHQSHGIVSSMLTILGDETCQPSAELARLSHSGLIVARHTDPRAPPA